LFVDGFSLGRLLRTWIPNPWAEAALVVLASCVLAFVVEFLVRRIVLVLVHRTKTGIDDAIVDVLRWPLYFSLILVSMAQASRIAPLPQGLERFIDSSLLTFGIFLWGLALSRVATLAIQSLANHAEEHSIIQVRTQPLFDIFSKLFLMGLVSYFVLLAWKINVGAWLASAGIVGIALGFAAKDSLSNLFAGIFIVAEAPYKLGDFVVLDGEIRGAVTSIGFRSTRLLTLDDIEIIVPNSLIGNAQIVNESGGPNRQARVGVTVECAYGSDVDLVREVMLKCAEGAPHVSPSPAPLVRFVNFGGSGLVHRLLVWIDGPRYREVVVDELNRRVYKAFAQAGIEIPFSKQDLYLKQVPTGLLFPRQEPEN
jgi:MscS family membrane protein